MSTFLWPAEDGWPYPDGEAELVDLDATVDDDALLLKTAPAHLFDTLDPVERKVVTAHYGLDGSSARSMKELHTELGMSRAEVREALASGLAKLRLHLSA
jgi:DNA-directed RNA polymerase sigma subunit (sigma70/sigma32)